ncbi:MAG: universal stress protein [Pontibacter sp.]|nr:universal stress protein [Pontibacter sp.]
MKSIFISLNPTDNARKVALIAAACARETGSRLILFQCYHHSGTPNVERQPLESERVLQQRLDKLACTLHQQSGVSVSRLVKPYTGSENVLEIAEQLNATLVIVCNSDPDAADIPAVCNKSGVPAILVSTATPLDETLLRKLITAHFYTPETTLTP